MTPLKIPGKLTVCELENGRLLVDLPIKMVIFHSYDQTPPSTYGNFDWQSQKTQFTYFQEP